MRLKAKPKKPVNLNVDYYWGQYFGERSLGGLVKEFEAMEVSADEVRFVQDYDCVDIVYKAPRWTEKQFKAELDKYEGKLKAYNEWYKENKAEIEAELKERKEMKAKLEAQLEALR